MKIRVNCESSYDGKLPISISIIKTCASKFVSYVLKNANIIGFSEKFDYAFDLLLCDNDFIHNINRDYRQIDAPTDVITFALYNDGEDKIITDNTINLGQIIISIDKTKSQAKKNNVSPEYELLNLLAHGVLHLLGFDHPDDEQLENMLALQIQMIESVDYVKI